MTATLRESLGWSGALAAALAIHAAIPLVVMAFTSPPQLSAAPPAMQVELAPLVISEAVPVASSTTVEVEAEPVEELAEAIEAQIVDEAESVPEVAPEPENEIAVEEVAPTPVVKKPAVVIAPKKAKTVERKQQQKPVERKPEKLVKKREPAKPAAANTGKASTAKSAAGASTSRRQQKAGSGATESSASKSDLSRWHRQVLSAVSRRKPRNTRTKGRAVIAFVVSANGAVTSARLQQSSGNGELDNAALAMVRNARIPAPPAGAGRSSFPFSVPVSFQ